MKEDLANYLFKINTDPNAKQFTDDKKFSHGYITLAFACLNCHADRNASWAAQYAKGIHKLGKYDEARCEKGVKGSESKFGIKGDHGRILTYLNVMRIPALPLGVDSYTLKSENLSPTFRKNPKKISSDRGEPMISFYPFFVMDMKERIKLSLSITLTKGG
ncbi:MAG: hypothetical protein QME83_09360 [Thermodesulfobacteriota bacterium]|nr:hypothetical protein [Thermodesulfobacteriota bacterium]